MRASREVSQCTDTTDVSVGSTAAVKACPRYIRLAGNCGHLGLVMGNAGGAFQMSAVRDIYRSSDNRCRVRAANALAANSGFNNGWSRRPLLSLTIWPSVAIWAAQASARSRASHAN